MQNNDYGPFEPLPPDTPAPTPHRKRGPTPKPADEQRTHRIAVYLSQAEMKVVSGFSELSNVCPAAYLRKAALNTPPVVIPELNQLVWQQLSNAAANLNQIAKQINCDDLSVLEEVRTALIRFRQALVKPHK
ncbi:mobilisation protein (MobC) [Trichlorobacter thiogenes]|uniref:Mobilisation protein (MobC) n=1 Tax=Trichlorobacter thiogenes TaxID=115783 RepID=A0A1T4M6R0_9BACT|nr:plasmid mobilization relaxosome protein MobC [Trichlorobacter thiogenes]SJZ62414.1 mobilisation protein (MobC) [Trichlorobacter thiogenes]